MNAMYMVRCGERGFLFDVFKDNKLVAIGWNEIESVGKIKDINQIKELLRKKYPDDKDQTINMNAGQIYRFAHEFQIGDQVITYNSDERIYLVGTIKSEYCYDPNVEYHHIRNVEWNGQVSRDILSTPTKNSLGSIATIFEVTGNSKQEILNNISKDIVTIETVSIKLPENESLESIKEDFEERAHEFIKDKILGLDWVQMQELVASIVRSLGFKTRISPQGSDRGKDIVASPDGLGLEEPRILIEVKHRQGQMGSQEIRSFLGGFRQGNKGVYVSTGGFSKDAKYEAERANYPLTLIDADFLVELIISNYDNFDIEGRALIPLRKVYWPV
jgi:restriction system protein